MLSSLGTPLDPPTRAFFEPRFGQDFSHVRVHSDARAARSAQDIGATAYTSGSRVVVDSTRFDAHAERGRELLAHELAHVVQNGNTGDSAPSRIGAANAPEEASADSMASAALGGKQAPAGKSPAQAAGRSAIRRKPAAPSAKGVSVPYDRSKVALDPPVSDVVGVGTGSVATQKVNVSVSLADCDGVGWELFNSADELVMNYFTISATPNPFEINEGILKAKLKQGRYMLRCTAMKGATPLAYSETSFYVWSSTPLSAKSGAQLAGILSKPDQHSLGEVSAAKARSMMLTHQAAVDSTGTGTLQGNRCTTSAPSGVAQSDCTQYVYDILKYAFGAKGDSATWQKVATKAATASGSGGLRGTALQRALETQAGWKGVFWSPSPRNPGDSNAEHPVAYKRVREKGLYSSDDVAVENANSVINYRPTATTVQPEFNSLDQLKKVPLGVISARGGKHMTLLINGQVYEVHWDKPATDRDVIEATPLERWVWESGVIVMPPSDFKAAFGP